MISLLDAIDNKIIDKNGNIIRPGDKVRSVANANFKGRCSWVTPTQACNTSTRGTCAPMTISRYKEIIYRDEW